MSEFTRFTAEVSLQYARKESKILKQDVYRVMDGFRYFIGSEDSGSWVAVPRGYLTDGASVPRMLWSMLPPLGAYSAAVVVHDILCEYLSITKDGKPSMISRERADEILAEAMEVLGVPATDRRTINIGVAGYRKVSGTKDPVWHRKKAQLEAQWLASNPTFT